MKTPEHLREQQARVRLSLAAWDGQRPEPAAANVEGLPLFEIGGER